MNSNKIFPPETYSIIRKWGHNSPLSTPRLFLIAHVTGAVVTLAQKLHFCCVKTQWRWCKIAFNWLIHSFIRIHPSFDIRFFIYDWLVLSSVIIMNPAQYNVSGSLLICYNYSNIELDRTTLLNNRLTMKKE